MLVAVVATLASFVLLMFVPGSAINHQGTYATQLLIDDLRLRGAVVARAVARLGFRRAAGA